MKRILRFIAFLFMPMLFLHQAYVYESPVGGSYLCIEFSSRFGDFKCDNGKTWIGAIWTAAKEKE